jgi:SRSO17 transposase
MAVRLAGKGCALGTHATRPSSSWTNKPKIADTAQQIAQDLEPAAWQRLSAGEGTKGPRLFDWAYLELADLNAEDYDTSGVWARGLLIRRSIADGACAFFSRWCPTGTGIETLAAIEGHRWARRGAVYDMKFMLRSSSTEWPSIG